MNDRIERTAQQLAKLAREEDLGSGDLTTALLPDPDQRATFALLAKQSCVFAGRRVANIILLEYDKDLALAWSEDVDDGVLITAPSAAIHPTGNRPGGTSVILATLTGPLRSILAVERVLLNFLQRLCGIATLTRRYVDAVAGTRVVICDTRKTTPGWRLLEKYAVTCGGGTNHRRGLYDGVLIKDNHLSGIPAQRLAANVFDMLNRLEADRRPLSAPRPFVEVEADSIEQVEALLSVVGIDCILLDNCTVDSLRQAVALRESLGLGKKVLFEASGGITLDTVRTFAETGVDRISIGALTHSVPSVDLSLERTE